MIDFIAGLVLLIIILGVAWWAIVQRIFPTFIQPYLPGWAIVLLEVLLVIIVVFIAIKVMVALLGTIGIHPLFINHI